MCRKNFIIILFANKTSPSSRKRLFNARKDAVTINDAIPPAELLLETFLSKTCQIFNIFNRPPRRSLPVEGS